MKRIKYMEQIYLPLFYISWLIIDKKSLTFVRLIKQVGKIITIWNEHANCFSHIRIIIREFHRVPLENLNSNEMNKVVLSLTLFLIGINYNLEAQIPKYDVEVVTCVESLVPGGVGRSRMFSTKVELNYLDFTSHQTAAKKDRNKSKRSNIRLKNYEETKLLNLYNEGGIRFQNIATNDALVNSKINTMLSEGWDLFFVSTGVESKMATVTVKKELLKMGIKMLLDDDSSSESDNDPNGLFMTRYFFRKELK